MSPLLTITDFFHKNGNLLIDIAIPVFIILALVYVRIVEKSKATSSFINILNQSRSIRIFIVVFCMVFLMPFLYTIFYPDFSPFYSFANDSFYYFDLARNSQNLNFFSFDGMFPTNGFHPAWEIVLYLAVKAGLIDFSVPFIGLNHIFILNLFFISLASAFFALFSLRYLENKWLAITMFAPGYVWFFLAIASPDYLATWSYINGMESALGILFFSLALVFYEPNNKRVLRNLLSISFMGLAVLARLDDIFFFVAYFLFLFLNANKRDRIRILLYFSPVSFLIMVYLIYNYLTVGIIMPISGWEKSGFYIVENIKTVIYTIVPYASWDIPNFAGGNTVRFSIFTEIFMRVFQLIFPLLISSYYLIRSKRKENWMTFSFIDIICIGVILKGLYNLFFVPLWRQGSWYFGNSVFVTNFLIALFISYVLKNVYSTLLKNQSPQKTNFWFVSVYLIISVITFNAFINHKANVRADGSLFNIYSYREELVQKIKETGENKFIEFEDGILGFSSNFPSIGGLGPILDPEASRARAKGKFLDLLYNRGYRLAIAGGHYIFTINDYIEKKAWIKGESLWGMKPSEFNDYSFELIDMNLKAGFSFYRLKKNKDLILNSEKSIK
jgi:hypothetical protein